MPDITDLILADHDTFRRDFVTLFGSDGPPQIEVWQRLATLLEVHADAEEQIFYPALLKTYKDAKAETKDAIKDHNKIRDAIREAADSAAGEKKWWAALKDARDENAEHMSEEEAGPLPDFRRTASEAERAELGARFTQFHIDHRGGRDIDTSDKDPRKYLAEHPSS